MQNDENDFYDRSMIKPEYKYSDITEIIIGCAMKVHNSLGPGFPEVIYQRGFEIELKKLSWKSSGKKNNPFTTIIS